MSEHAAAEYQQALTDLEDNFKSGIRAFAEWFAKEWVTSPEQWRKAFEEPVPSDDWFRGHNTGVEGVLMALDTFFDEYHP